MILRYDLKMLKERVFCELHTFVMDEELKWYSFVIYHSFVHWEVS